MKVFANENLFEPIIDYLRHLGNDVLSIRDSGLSGISDDEVYEKACKENKGNMKGREIFKSLPATAANRTLEV